MGYIEKNLFPAETLAYRTGCHWIVMLWPLIGGAVLGLVGIAFFAGGWMAIRNGGRYEGAIVWGALALLGAVALIAGGVIRRFATEVAVSNRRVLIKTGLFSRRSVEVLLPKVESIGVDEVFVWPDARVWNGDRSRDWGHVRKVRQNRTPKRTAATGPRTVGTRSVGLRVGNRGGVRLRIMLWQPREGALADAIGERASQ